MSQEFPPAPTLEGFKVLGEIGRGGYGIVYKAEQTVLGRTVAIKNIAVDLSKEQGMLDRFMREARIVAQIGDHENIVQIHDVKEQNGVPCIIMEYVEGVSLADRLFKGNEPDFDESVRIVSYTLRALQYAHEHNITHRDVKPENIMITKQDKVKVMDFGIAFSGELPRLTQRGFAVGTPQYMSPEQLRGRPVDGRSDIYSVAVLFFYLVAGRLPFDDTDPRELGLKHIKAEPPSPREFRPEIPAEIEKIILKGLAKKPEDRFQEAKDFEAGLQEYLMAASSSAPSFTQTFQAYKRAKDPSSPSHPTTPEEPVRIPTTESEATPGETSDTLDSDLDLPASVERAPEDKPEPKKPAPAPQQADHPAQPAAAEAGALGRALAPVLVLLVIAAAWVSFSFFKQRDDPNFERYMTQGNQLLQAGQWMEAEKVFNQAAEVASTEQAAEPRAKLTEIALTKGKFEATVELGQAALARGDAEGAVSAFEAALTLAPGDEAAQKGLEEARALDGDAATSE